MVYRAFCDECRLKIKNVDLNGARIIFHVPMPNSWSNKKKVRMNTRPHQQRPDIDNYCKGIFDALHTEDSHIADVCLSKRWAYEGGIEINRECKK